MQRRFKENKAVAKSILFIFPDVHRDMEGNMEVFVGKVNH